MTSPMTETVTDLTKGVYRRLYSGFTKGQRINKLSLQAEAWFWRILATVDDFGNGDADPELCRFATAGHRQNITSKQISGWLREMRDVGLITFYSVKGEPFLHIEGFEESQPAGKNGRRIRRFEPPGESGGIQNNPDVVSASYSDNDNDTKDDTDNGAVALDSPPFSGDEFLQALRAYDRTAKQRKVKESPEQRRLLFKKLAAWGEVGATHALEDTVANGWRGVFEPKNGNGNGTYTQNNELRRPNAAERNNEQLKRNLARVEQLRRQGSGNSNEVEGGNRSAINR